jgi:hypothetical protein
MKAICTKRLLENTISGIFLVEEGEVVDYTVREKKFIIRGVAISADMFFNYFKVTEGFEKMNYSDFEYILCNYVFDMAILFPEEYNGIRSLIIQDWNGRVIMITVNKNEDVIRVSFDETQEKYSSYEEALDGIKNHK